MLMAGGGAASQTPRKQRDAVTANPEPNAAGNLPVGVKFKSDVVRNQTIHIIRNLQAAEVSRSLGINALFRGWLSKRQLNKT
jgi:hypothetical protein